MSEDNRDPFAEPRSLDEAAINVNELFMSYVKAGFTRPEALTLTMDTMHTGARQAAEERRRREETDE